MRCREVAAQDLGVAGDLVPPARDVPIGDRLRTELRQRRVGRERGVEPASDSAERMDLGDEVVAEAPAGRGVALDAVARRAESGERVVPTVSAVLDEELQDGYRGGATSPIDVLDPTGQSRSIGELGPARQKVRDLDFGVDAVLRAAEGLQDQRPVEEKRG